MKATKEDDSPVGSPSEHQMPRNHVTSLSLCKPPLFIPWLYEIHSS